jgi:seryl-tRNA synthetase
MSNKLSIAERKAVFSKLAKKSATYGLTGKHNKKSLEKMKSQKTTRFSELRKSVTAKKAEIDKLTAEYEADKEELQAAKKDIMDCHDLMRNMDFADASEVKVGKDSSDVSYACDGKWVHYDMETGDKDLYSKWKKSKNPTVEIIEESDDVPEEINDIDDPDGVDITV